MKSIEKELTDDLKILQTGDPRELAIIKEKYLAVIGKAKSVRNEWRLLCGLLISPELITEMNEIVDIADFRGLWTKGIFQVMLRMNAEGAPIDPITVEDWACRAIPREISNIVKSLEENPSKEKIAFLARLIRNEATLKKMKIAEEVQEAMGIVMT